MGMSAGGGGSAVKAEPNVTPMIDVMLVLLIIGVTLGSALMPPPWPVDIAMVLPPRASAGYCEIGLPPDTLVLNSRVKRDRPNSPLTPRIR